MFVQQGDQIRGYVHYALDGVSATGLTVTVTIYEGVSGAAIVSGGACTELGSGLYHYTLAGVNVDADEPYLFVFSTAGDVDQADLASIFFAGASHAVSVGAVEAGVQTALVDAISVEEQPDHQATLDAIAGQILLTEAQVQSIIDTHHSAQLAQHTTTQGAISSLVNLSAQQVWEYVERTLTAGDVDVNVEAIAIAVYTEIVSNAATVISALLGQSRELIRGDSWSEPISGLGDLTGWTKITVTGKTGQRGWTLDDEDALWKVELVPAGGPGLLVIAGAPAATAANGSITVSDLTGGVVSLNLAAVETAKLPVVDVVFVDVQVEIGSEVKTRTRALWKITWDVTRST